MLGDFELRDLTFDGATRPVYRIGSGPAVIVMHEVPGLYPEIADFGRKVAAAGFTAYLPSLIGTPDKPFGAGYSATSMLRACVAREFTVWATRKNSAITDWLRALARFAHDEAGGGVGAVGMCLTGGFALAMMVDDVIKAPVLSQPSLPLALTPSRKRDLGIDDATLARVRQRCADGACVMGLRFTHDPLVPPERFARLRDELGDQFLAVEIDSGPGNPHGLSRTAHSVLVYDHVDEPDHPTQQALERVIDFFVDRLQ